MKKLMASLLVLSLFSLILIINCDTRKPTGSIPDTTIESVAEVRVELTSGFKAPSGQQSISIKGIALDENGGGVSGVELIFNESSEIGWFSYVDDSTDQYGVQDVLFNFNLHESIDLTITAEVKDISEIYGSGQLVITLLDQPIESISLEVAESVLLMGSALSVSDSLFATVVDTNGNGIPGLLVNFKTDIGTISNTDTTNNSGVVGATITFSSGDIPPEQNAISTWVKASIGSGVDEDSVLISVLKQSIVPNSIVVFSNPNYLMVPQGSQGNSTITAVVMDENGGSVPGAEIDFVATGGYINSPAITDTSGEAVTTLKSLPLYSDITVQVIASTSFMTAQGEQTLSDTTYIEFIEFVQSIGNIYVYAEPPQIVVAPGDVGTTTIKAMVSDSDGVAIPNLQVNFQCDSGAVTPSILTDYTGLATATYYSNGHYGTATINAVVGQDIGSTTVQISATGAGTGTVEHVFVYTEPSILTVEPGEVGTSTIKAIVSDINSVVIPGVEVTFRSDTGAVSLPSLTDSTGIATGTFYNNDFYGTTEIRAIAGQVTGLTTITIDSTGTGLDIIGSIYVYGDPPVITAQPGELATTSVRAIVFDINNVSIPNVLVLFQCNHGVITPASLTDSTGLASATYYSTGYYGEAMIEAIVGEDTSSTTVTIDSTGTGTINIGSIFVNADPPMIFAQPGEVASTNVSAMVTDIYNVAIPNIFVTFLCDSGAITPADLTDTTGVATATYFSNGYYGEAMIQAIVGEDTGSTKITVNLIGTGTGYIFMNSDRDTIYADGDVTYANVVAVLKDLNNEAIVNDTVHFSTTSQYSTIASPIITDSTGSAYTFFNDVGVGTITGIEPSTVTARYYPLNLETSLELYIQEFPPVDSIKLTSAAGTGGLQANGIDSAFVYAYVYLENGQFAPEGTRIQFSANKGTITPTDTVVHSGKAVSVYVSPAETGTATIRASWKEDPNVYDTLEVELRAGNPVNIILDSVEPETLNVGGSPATITATVKDTVGNGVPNQEVYWSTDLGSITLLSVTNQDGQTSAILDPQTQAGVALVTAKVSGLQDSLVIGVPILPNVASSIQLSSEFDQLQIQGTGGQESTPLIATVKDANGNNVANGVSVYFRLINYPAGTRFDNGEIVDTAATNAGEARVSLNSGWESGPVRVRAVTFLDTAQTDSIFAEKSNINISSGDPYIIDIDYSNSPQEAGLNMHGASLMIEVSARVFDEYGNNVSQGTAVFFSIGPDSTMSAWYGPEHAHIDGTSIIEDTTGTAFTLLYYNSEDTYSMIDIIAECIGADSTVQDVADSVKLPLFNGRLELIVQPPSHFFTSVHPTAYMKVIATLFDGTESPINNARLTFGTSMGLYFCCDSATCRQTLTANWFPGPLGYWRFEQDTGPNPPDPQHGGFNQSSPQYFHQLDGQAIMWMRAEEMATAYYPGVFTDPLTPNTAGDVSATLTNDPSVSSDPVTVTFIRQP